MYLTLLRSLAGLLGLAMLLVSPLVAAQAKPFTAEQLDQMLAQIALYPDSLLSQVLMASTYPTEFQQAVAWSKANPDEKGDEAVTKVQDKDWDTSVASLVAFPEVLITLGEKPDYVKNLGDAFLAQPEEVMDSVQRLRAAAQKAGNLKTNEQIKVTTEAAPPPAAPAQAPPAPASTTVVQPPPVTQTIVIEPAQPSVVYVPAYNPAVVYGTWWWPAYPPYYYPPPPGYWFSRGVGAAVSWGVGFAVGSALWGGFNWHNHDVNIDIERHNNININKQINAEGRKTNWSHNSEHRKSDAYRGGTAEKQRLDQKRATTERQQYRGKGDATASRERAQQTMQSRGIESPQGSARDRAQTMNRDEARQRAQGGGQGNLGSANRGDAGGASQRAQSMDRDAARQQAQSFDRDAARQRSQSMSHDNAFKSVNNSNARAQQARGASSSASAARSHGAGGARAGGGGARGGGGGGRR